MHQLQEARSGDGVVSLDLTSDDYFCRYDPVSGPVWAPVSGDAADPLHAASPPPPGSFWKAIGVPLSPSPRVIDLIHFTVAFAQSVIRYRDHKVGALIMIAQSLKTSRRGDRTAQQAATTFRTLLPLLPVRPQCLFEAFFLLHFLARYGHRRSWIFGAHLFPFRAHCWVAERDILLNEAAHRIEDYQVILTVEPLTS